MENKDVEMINELRGDSRKKLSEISKAIGVPTTTLFYKLKRHEKETIKKYSSLLNYKKCGWNCHVNLFINVKEGMCEVFRKYVVESKHVNSAYVLKEGGFCLELVFVDELELQVFVKDTLRAYGVVSIEEFHLIEEIKLESMVIPWKDH